MTAIKKHNISTHPDPERQKILDYAGEKFLREGFYKISMDSLANEIRISKKTIYKHFSSKDELVEKIAEQIMQTISGRIETVIKSELNALGKALKLFEIMGDVTLKLTDKWVQDVKLHHPDLWKKIDGFRTKRAYTALSDIIKQGQEEGCIIKKPAELMITLFVSAIRSIVNPDFLYYHKFNYKEAFVHSFEILFNGILTSKGKKEFNKIFAKVIK